MSGSTRVNMPEDKHADLLIIATKGCGVFAEGAIAVMTMVTTTRTIRTACYNGRSNLIALDYCPNLIFDNDTTGNEAAKRLAEDYLLPFFHKDLERLANMVRLVPDFPRQSIEFRHVLNIS
jgi:hypothetical protein